MVKRASISTSDQPDLFQHLDHSPLGDGPSTDLSLNVELIAALRAAIRDARATYGFSRERITDRMNACLESDQQITVRQLNAWTAVSQEFKNYPAAWLPAFCWATRSMGPFQVLLSPLGYEAIDQADQMAQHLGELELQSARITRQRALLKARLGA